MGAFGYILLLVAVNTFALEYHDVFVSPKSNRDNSMKCHMTCEPQGTYALPRIFEESVCFVNPSTTTSTTSTTTTTGTTTKTSPSTTASTTPSTTATGTSTTTTPSTTSTGTSTTTTPSTTSTGTSTTTTSTTTTPSTTSTGTSTTTTPSTTATGTSTTTTPSTTSTGTTTSTTRTSPTTTTSTTPSTTSTGTLPTTTPSTTSTGTTTSTSPYPTTSESTTKTTPYPTTSEPTTQTETTPFTTTPYTTTYEPPTTTNPPSSYECSAIRRQVCLAGDPHYSTFDGAHFDYQGTCPHIFMKPCNESNEFPYFSVKVQHKRLENLVSAIYSTVIEIHNNTIYMDRENTLFVNGIRENFPFVYSLDDDEPLFTITLEKPWKRRIVTKDSINVIFDHFTFCVDIPDCPAYFGSDVLCGLAGSYDGNCLNDVEVDDRLLGSSTKQSCRYANSVSKWANTFITSEYFNPGWGNETIASCDIGVDTNNSQSCGHAFSLCKPLMDAKIGHGQFSACNSLNNTIYDDLYTKCVNDVCDRKLNACSAMIEFAEECGSEEHLIQGWQDSIFGCKA